MEYTKRIRFLTGSYVRIVSPVYYLLDIKKKLKIGTGIIEVKKEYTYERGERSKVLMVYAIESLAQQIDKMFSNLELERYKYVSYRMSNSKVWMMSMHGNEMNNVKAHYKILYNVRMDNEVVENN